VGGVTCASASTSSVVRDHGARYAHSAHRLAQHRRRQADLGLCVAPPRLNKRQRAAKRQRDAERTRETLRQRQAEGERQATERRLQEGSALYHAPDRVHGVNPAFGRAPADDAPADDAAGTSNPTPVTPAEQGLKPVHLGNQRATAEADQRALAAKGRGKVESKRGKGGEGPVGLPPDSESGRRDKRDKRFATYVAR
jgi:hypothetical protein